jgi:photosystem II stability/assembly factor-like uncharacterized protein
MGEPQRAFHRRSVCIGGLAFGASGCATHVLLTTLPDNSWWELPTEPFPRKQDDICFITPDIGWHGNDAGKLFQTTDGGQTWRPVQAPGFELAKGICGIDILPQRKKHPSPFDPMCARRPAG